MILFYCIFISLSTEKLSFAIHLPPIGVGVFLPIVDKTPRGYHPRSLNSNNRWNVTSNLPFLNMPLLTYADEIENAVLLVHGEKAHSRYLSDSTFKKLKENDMVDYEHHNKNYIIVPGASHTDLYGQKDKIPFDAIETFYREHLK